MSLKHYIGLILPDRTYLKFKYRERTGKKLSITKPKTFNEKLQWLKLNDRRQEYTMMVDKYSVKSYVSKMIGEEYIIPTFGVWNRFDQIDFDSLPNQFVLKCTHDSGGLSICKDKSTFDLDSARIAINKSLKRNYYYYGREWPYKNVTPRIIAEQLLPAPKEGLIDYKFYCFNGKPVFLYISQGLDNHETAKINYVNLDWTKSDIKRNDYDEFDVLPEKPKNFSMMIEIAQELSKGIPFVRVDLYNIEGRIYFSELTFFPGSGFTPFLSDDMDLRIGDLLDLPMK